MWRCSEWTRARESLLARQPLELVLNAAKRSAAPLAELNARGYLHAIYAMLASLGHLQILARSQHPAALVHRRGGLNRKKQNPRHFRGGGFVVRTLAVTYSRMAAATLSSARSVFTSEFEMGSGGSRSL